MFVVGSLNYGYNVGNLSVTQKQGIITCLPKGDKARHFLKNWRPISLLNTVYKIGSGVIASRIKKFLPILINTDQTGFISGRYIGENIRLLFDLMEYTEEKEIPGLLLLIDFEKAFDSVSWSFLNNVLKFFNFGESISKWVQVFYKNINSAVIQGGNLSNFFTIGRGCRQGDPLSPYLFILCAEIMAIRIRGNEKIKGIKIFQTEHQLSQFADDTSVILDGSEESLAETLLELKWFAKVSGLKINFSKTQVVWIGSKKFSKDTLCEDWQLSWGKSSFKVLGINFDVNLDNLIRINYDPYLKRMKGLIQQWNKRNLTPIGKITVVKSLILPVLNQLFISLPNPSSEIIKMIEDMLYSFIWKSPLSRVRKEVVQKEYEDGGLKMVNVKNFIYALKTTWIRRLSLNNSKWQNLFNCSVSTEKLFGCGTAYVDKVLQTITNKFWKDVLYCWKLTVDKNFKDGWSDFLSSPIWYNNMIKVGGKCMYLQKLFEKGIRYVNDFINSDGNFFTYEQFIQNYAINISVMEYNSIFSCLNRMSKLFQKDVEIKKISYPFIPSALEFVLKSKKGSKDIYNILNKNSCTPTAQGKLNEVFNFSQDQWTEIYRLPFTITKNTKLQWLQFRINHNILVTNHILYKVKIVNNKNCSFCNNETETIEHIFWGCNIVQNFFSELCAWFRDNNIPAFQLSSKKSVLFGNFDETNNDYVYNIILLHIKQYIYTTRCLKKILSLNALKKQLTDMYHVEKMLATNKQTLTNFHTAWTKYETLFGTGAVSSE